MADTPFSSFVGALAADTVTGAEKVPMLDTDGSTVKHLTPALVAAYVIDQIVGAAAITSLSDTHQFPVFTSADDEKIVTGANVIAWIVDELEALTLGTSIVSGDHLIYSDGGVLKRITIDNVLTYINSTNGTLGAQIAALSAATLADTDQYVLAQTSTALKTTFADIAARVHSQIATYVAALSAVTTPADSDKLYILQGATAKYVTLTVLANTYLAAELNLENLQWPTSTTTPSAAGDKLLMERSGTISEVDIDTLSTYFSAGLQASVLAFSGLAAAVPNAADLFAVDDSGTAKKLTLANLETKLWADLVTWIAAQTAVVTVTDSDKFLTIQSGTAKYVTPVELATYMGLGTVENLDINGMTAIGAALEATDLIIVDDGAGGTNRSAAMSRVKTFIDTVGTQKSIWFGADDIQPCTTNPPGGPTDAEVGSNLIMMTYLAFDAGATEERAQIRHVMPLDWDLTDIRLRAHWSSATGSTAGDTVEWGFKAVLIRNDDAIDAAFGQVQSISDVLLANNGADLQVSPAVEIVPAGTLAAGAMLVIEVFRNTDGTDDMAEDAWLFGVELQYNANVEVSAWSPATSSSPSSSPSTSPSTSPSSSPSTSASSSPSSSASSSPSSSPSAT